MEILGPGAHYVPVISFPLLGLHSPFALMLAWQ